MLGWPTACESLATAVGIEISPAMLWIGVNSIFKGELWDVYSDVYYDDFEENWPRYNDTAL